MCAGGMKLKQGTMRGVCVCVRHVTRSQPNLIVHPIPRGLTQAPLPRLWDRRAREALHPVEEQPASVLTAVTFLSHSYFLDAMYLSF